MPHFYFPFAEEDDLSLPFSTYQLWFSLVVFHLNTNDPTKLTVSDELRLVWPIHSSWAGRVSDFLFQRKEGICRENHSLNVTFCVFLVLDSWNKQTVGGTSSAGGMQSQNNS